VRVSDLTRYAERFLLLSTFSVRAHARYDAQQSPPQPVDDAMSPTEQRLGERFEHRMAVLVSERDRALRSERINAIANDLAAEERNFEDIVRETKNAMWIKRLQFSPTWIEARERVRHRRKDLEDFKNDNLIHREASYHSLLLAIGILALATVLETLANAFLFAQVSRWGLAGGALNSLALSLPNLALGFAAGFWGLRGRYHITPSVRWFATAFTLFAFSAVLAWNFYVGHLRALAERRMESRRPLLLSEWHDVVAQIINDPGVLFVSPYAILLFAVGLLVFAVAVHDGHDLVADRYIGFARVDRRLRAAMAAADRIKWKFFKQLTQLTNHGVERIKTRKRSIEKKCIEGLHILDRARSIIARFNHQAANHLWVHRGTVREYQSRNRRMRAERQIPARFDKPISSDIVLPEYDWRGMREKIRSAGRIASDAADAVTIVLTNHLLATMHEIDREPLDPVSPNVPSPPLLQPAAETV
jgi:hypothetical protein